MLVPILCKRGLDKFDFALTVLVYVDPMYCQILTQVESVENLDTSIGYANSAKFDLQSTFHTRI